VKYQSVETEVGSSSTPLQIDVGSSFAAHKHVRVPIASSCQCSPEISLRKKFSVKYPIVLQIIQKVILLSITKISKTFKKIMPT
jgi:hypothetical protein